MSENEKNLPGYHLRDIQKGIFGRISKIREELEELEDAHDQGNKIMALCEVADLYGAIEGYLELFHPATSMDDVKKMAEATKRAFESGRR